MKIVINRILDRIIEKATKAKKNIRKANEDKASEIDRVIIGVKHQKGELRSKKRITSERIVSLRFQEVLKLKTN